jgi:hypothetical protein
MPLVPPVTTTALLLNLSAIARFLHARRIAVALRLAKER